jgi:hypothetical protein
MHKKKMVKILDALIALAFDRHVEPSAVCNGINSASKYNYYGYTY